MRASLGARSVGLVGGQRRGPRSAPQGCGLPRWLSALIALLLWALAGGALAQLAVPALQGRVVDQVGLLAPGQREALEQQLAAVEAQEGTQIVVLAVASTLPEDIASYAQRVGDSWKIGRRTVGDGLLILVARDDRKVRIEVAKALEGAVPDLAARRIIDRQITPAFKRGDYAGGLQAAVGALAERVHAEGLPAPASGAGAGGGAEGFNAEGVNWEELAIFFFVAVPIIGAVLSGIFGRALGSLGSAGLAGLIAWNMTTSLWVAGAAGVLALVLVGVIGIGAGSGYRGHFGGGGASGGW